LINIEEYLAPSVDDDPAWNLAYLSALEQSQAQGGARSCWARTYTAGPWGPGGYSGCNWSQLDNLADLGGNNPMAAWWVTKLYGDLRGSVVPALSSSSYLPTLATVYDNTVTLLHGQATTCSGEIRSSVNPFCPAAWTSAPMMSVAVRVRLPAQGDWTVTSTEIPNVVDVLPTLATPSTQTVHTDAEGWVTLQVSAADGAVTQLRFTPAA
jgi:hypothetical protein